MRYFICITVIFLLQSSSAFGQLSQLVYLKTFPANVSPLEEFSQSSSAYSRRISGMEANVAIFPFQSPIAITTQLENGVTQLSYNSDLEVNSLFETKSPLGGSYAGLKSLVKQDDFMVYSHQNNVV